MEGLLSTQHDPFTMPGIWMSSQCRRAMVSFCYDKNTAALLLE